MRVVKVVGYQSGCGQNTVGLRYFWCYEVEIRLVKMEESEKLAVTEPRVPGLSH